MGRKSKVKIARDKSFPPQAHERRLTVAVCFFLVVIVWIVFGQTLHFEFVNYDDPAFVTKNPYVLNGLTWEDFKWAFRFDQGDYWHPLTWLSLMLDASLFGRGAGGMHLTNVLLHTANSILLFLLLRRWTGAFWRSALVAALFAIHPLRVESVAWVTERKDVLSTLFWMLTLWAYTCYANEIKIQSSKAKIFYRLVLLLFVLGLMSKAMLVTLPLVMLLLDYWPLERIRQLTFPELRSALPQLLMEKIPLFLLSAISVVLTYWGQHREAIAPTPEDHSLMLRMENVFVAYSRYLEKTFWPVNLAIPYTHPGHWNWLEIIWSVALVVGLCVMAWRLRQRKPYVFVGWFWFAITLIPVIGLTRGWLQFMADRFTYVPLMGIFLLAVWSVADLCAGWRHHRKVLGGCAAIILVALIICAHVQTSYWQNSEMLFRHADNITDSNDLAAYNVGCCLDAKGQLNEAIRYYRKAVEFNPARFDAENNLASALDRTGNATEALEHYRVAFRLGPNNAEVCNNLGAAIAKTGAVDEAATYFLKAIQLAPNDAKAYCNLGHILAAKNKNDEAIAYYDKAIALNPQFADAYIKLGDVFSKLNRFAQAKECYEKAIQLDPGNSVVTEQLRNLGIQP
jgi:tetratricopeptide (TPR) repeat protein